jgi:hypothetical protein
LLWSPCTCFARLAKRSYRLLASLLLLALARCSLLRCSLTLHQLVSQLSRCFCVLVGSCALLFSSLRCLAIARYSPLILLAAPARARHCSLAAAASHRSLLATACSSLVARSLRCPPLAAPARSPLLLLARRSLAAAPARSPLLRPRSLTAARYCSLSLAPLYTLLAAGLSLLFASFGVCALLSSSYAARRSLTIAAPLARCSLAALLARCCSPPAVHCSCPLAAAPCPAPLRLAARYRSRRSRGSLTSRSDSFACWCVCALLSSLLRCRSLATARRSLVLLATRSISARSLAATRLCSLLAVRLLSCSLACRCSSLLAAAARACCSCSSLADPPLARSLLLAAPCCCSAALLLLIARCSLIAACD